MKISLAAFFTTLLLLPTYVGAQAQLNWGLLDTTLPGRIATQGIRAEMLQLEQARQQMQLIQQMEALRASKAQAEMQRLQQQETLRTAKAQADAAEEQARQATQEGLSSRARTASAAPELTPAMKSWLAAAQPRMYLFSDFAKIVFASDLAITVDMINLMAGSVYAADIAYYFGTHKGEALAVSQMSLLNAAQAIKTIEQRIAK